MKNVNGRVLKKLIVWLCVFTLIITGIPASAVMTAYAGSETEDGFIEETEDGFFEETEDGFIEEIEESVSVDNPIDDPIDGAIVTATETAAPLQSQNYQDANTYSSSPGTSIYGSSDFLIGEPAAQELQETAGAEETQANEVAISPLAVNSIRITGTEYYDYAYQVIALVNTERIKVGAPSLTVNSALSEAAMQRAAELSAYYSHTRPDGQSCFTVSTVFNSGWGGENIAAGHTSPAMVMTDWMNSQGHKDNIININYRSMGVGVFVHEGRIYWVQLFSSATSASPSQPLNVSRTRTINLNSSQCVFPSAAIVSDTTIQVGETKTCALAVTNGGPGAGSFAFRPDPSYNISWTSSNSSCLQALSAGMRGLAAGTATLKAEIPSFLTVSKTITVNPGASSGTTVGVTYRTHVESIGNQAAVSNGDLSGTTGRALRLEAIWISLTGSYSGSITYRTYVQDQGWQAWVSNNAMSGTSGQAKRFEAIQIILEGDIATKYDVHYRVHCQNYGWLDWTKNGGYAGSDSLGLRLEAIQIVLVTKNGAAPGDLKGYRSSYANSYVSGVLYRTHVQDVGWQGFVNNGAMSGTSGRALRLEAIEIKLTSDISGGVTGGIEYRTHVQDVGWQGFVSNGAMSGTSGRALRLEAIEIRLTGQASNYYDVWYRVHCQDYGWLGWARNGASAGSQGKAKRLEAIEIRLLPKGSPAPGSTTQSFIQ